MFKTGFTKRQLIEAGIIIVIILLFFSLKYKNELLLKASVVLLFLDLILPVIFYPFAFIWFNFSELLGNVVSKIILGIIFITVIFPVGIIRRGFGRDNLLLRKFKHDRHSVMKIRNYTYGSEDLDKPY